MGVISHLKTDLPGPFLSLLIIGTLLCIAFIGLEGCQKKDTSSASATVKLAAAKETAIAARGKPLRGEFAGAEEISAITTLQDGRFLGVGDEKEKPLFLFAHRGDGKFSTLSWTPEQLKVQAGPEFEALDDLEGLDVDGDGYIYAITSHSWSSGWEEGSDNKNREKFLRFKLKGDQLSEPGMCLNLKKHLVAGKAALEAVVDEKDVKNKGGFNIEGLAFDAVKKELLVGLRGPIVEGKAVLLTVKNPREIFTKGEAPKVAAEPYFLDLAGQGVRGMNWDMVLGGYTIISGPASKKKEKFKLWLWTGKRGDAPTLIKVTKGKKALKHAEGVTRLDDERLLVVSDRKPGRFALIWNRHLNLK